MSETKIIPLELKALICSHLLAQYNQRYLQYSQNMAPYDKNRLPGFAPLDIPEVRKTQRRVAALLGKDCSDIFPNKPSKRYQRGPHPYTDNEVHSIRAILGPGGSNKGHRPPVQVPLVPQNSWLDLQRLHDNKSNRTDDDDDEDNDDGDDVTTNLFDTSIFHDHSDPNSFKLPPVFAGSASESGGVFGKHDRVVPTISERSFVNSNLRHNYHDYRRRSSSDQQCSPLDGLSVASTVSSASPFLPFLDPRQRDLISMKLRDNDRNNNNIDNGIDPDDDVNEKGQGHSSKSDDVDELMSSMVRMMTLESELTRAGSLLMDENFIPMSVTITKLSQESNQTNSADDSVLVLDAGRFKEKSRTPKSKNGKTTAEITGTKNHRNINDNFCTCKEPRPLLIPSNSPCPCCLRTGGQHEAGCPQIGSRGDKKKREANLSCNLCGKPIGNGNRKRKEKGSKRHNKDGVVRKLSGPVSELARTAMTPETAINRFQSEGSSDDHHRQKCHSENGSDESEKERRSSKIRNQDHFTTSDHRVRFDDNVKTRHIYPDDEGGQCVDFSEKLDEDKNEGRTDKSGIAKSSLKSKPKKKLFVNRRDFNFPKIGKSVDIPNLGVSVHAMAYDLALKDARIDADIRSSKRGKNKGTQSSEFNGTMFSYFPLLRRPLSESDKPEIGLKSQEVKKVTGKNYKNMRHIFGKVKLADYYPGGKKWREV